jgi:hypothetical protein
MFDIVEEQEFIEASDTGDILLFRTNNTVGAASRTATNSHFDHVAMIVRKNEDPE